MIISYKNLPYHANKIMLRPNVLNKKYLIYKHEYKNIKNICAVAFNIPIVYLASGNASN